MKLSVLIEEKKGIILDIEGVLIRNVEIGEVYHDALKFMKMHTNKHFAFLTNLARLSSKYVFGVLLNNGYDMIKLEQIINPTIAAIGQVLDKEFKKPTRVKVSSEGGHIEDILRFPWIRIVNREPIDAILFGANRLLTYFELNYIYRLFKKGVPLIVLGGEYTAEGKIFDDQGEYLVEGAFAKALELAANKEAKYIGKPCKEMYLQALETLQLTVKDVIMIGDTFERDILGAVKLGIDSIWLNRGRRDVRKYLDELEEEAIPNTCVYMTDSLDPYKEVERIF